MVRGSDDSSSCRIGIMNEAMPNRTAQSAITLTNHECLAQSIEDVAKTVSTVSVKESIALI